MSSDPRIDELLQCWEEQRNQDQPPSPEDLCADCPELVDEVRRRLQALRAMDKALDLSDGVEEPTVADSDGLGKPVPALPAPAVSAAVEVRYRPLRFHARGGLGEVYLAEDEELHREVALKRIQSPHAQHAASRRRFIREAEITSRLEHPGIVPIYGLGQDAQGRPVYAMRFIQGETLQDAIERFHAADRNGHSLGERGLALRQLLGRFLAVCNAISYAHSRGVLHRDLKPSNVMLGKFGETLVVDWGLAKTGFEQEDSSVRSASEEAELTPRPIAADDTEPTQLGRAMGTPSYMSPEQAAGRWDVVGPASDIYSLGATLYCILTGQPPVRGSSVPEVLALTQHGEVTRPRLVNPSVPAALEAVCLKAMARQSEDRYPTVQALAADVEAWLADEPVAAYREPWTARLGRWARRHRPLVVGAAALVLTALVGLAVLAWQSEQGRKRLQHEQGETETARLLAERRAEEARTNALQAAENERQARLFETEGRQAFAKYFIAVSGDPDLREEGLEPLRKRLLEHAREYYQKFVDERGQDPTLRAELAAALVRLGSITAEIGDRQKAIGHYEQARALLQNLHDENPALLNYLHELAECHYYLANQYRETGRPKDAEEAFQKALVLQQKLYNANSTHVPYASRLAETYTALAVFYRVRGRSDDAEKAYHQALALHQKLHDAHPTAVPLTQSLARTRHNLGILYRNNDRTKEAEESLLIVRDLRQGLHADHPKVSAHLRDLAATLSELGLLYRQTNRTKEAEAAHREALDARQKLYDRHPTVNLYARELAQSHNNLGNLYGESSRLDASEAAHRKALRLQQDLHQEREVPQFAADLAATYNNLGLLARANGRPEEAKEFYHQALALREKLHKDDPAIIRYALGLASTLTNLGNLTLEGGNPESALAFFDRAITLVKKVLEGSPRHAEGRLFLRNAQVGRALNLARAGEPTAALRQAEEVLKEKDLPAARLYDLARVHALCFSLTNNEEHATSAVALLKRAVERGYKNEAQLKDNRDLDGLRSREDFKDLLWRMERTK